MKKFYERPDVEYISLIADEAIANSTLSGSTGVDNSIGDDEWD